jgi:ketosteroid isomerase-like protein
MILCSKGEICMNRTDAAGTRQPAWRQQIGELQDEARRAFLAQDVNGMGRILSDDFVVNSPVGRVLTRGEVLDLLRRGVIRHFSYEEQVELMTRRGDLAVVMGREVVTNAPDGPPVTRRFTNIWREAADSWKLVARHAQQMTEP